MKALSVLDIVEKAKGKSKQAYLTEHVDNTELKELLDAALNFDRKFNIKKFDVTTLERGLFMGNHGIFMRLLDTLQSRTITGNQAIETVEQFFNRCDEQEAKWYSRILRKDLKSGFGLSTAIKAGFDIPEFKVQLAKDGKKCKKLIDLLNTGCSASPKLDGYRCLAIIHDGDVTLHTRNGDTYENFPQIKETLSKLCPKGKHILDGEIMSDSFQSMQKSAFASKRGTTVGDVKYHVFDKIPVEEWETDTFTTKALERYRLLNKWFRSLPKQNKVVLVGRTTVLTNLDIQKLERNYIQQGYEGIMINPDIPYYKGRKSNGMLKFKTMHTMDCKVIAMKEGKGKLEGSLGCLVVEQENGVSCEVGSGFSEEERDRIWETPVSVEGRIIEVKYQDLTEGENRMRFPIFIRWRDFNRESGKI